MSRPTQRTTERTTAAASTSAAPTEAGVLVAPFTRRGFLLGLVSAGGLLLAAGTASAAVLRAAAGAVLDEADWTPGIWLSIAPDGLITIVAHRSEMGTGIRTSLPLVLADELGANWSRVKVVQAIGAAKYGSQNTDGSRSLRDFMPVMRQAGATARTLLCQAAGQLWGVDPAECHAENSVVTHTASERSATFAELVATAATLPAPVGVTLRPDSELAYVGRDVPITDLDDIVTGRASFGMDVRRPGMLFAMVERCPVVGGRVASHDDSAALAVPGVRRVVELPSASAPFAFNALGGLAVVADSTWAAWEGRRALEIEWDLGANAAYDSDTYAAELLASARAPGDVVLDRGDVDTALASAAQVIQADYQCPHLAHAPMETPCAVAEVSADACEVWTPTQNPQAAQQEVARALGLPLDRVTVHVTLLGGGFGRKSKPDYVVEAALLSRAVDAPVALLWTREDDIHHDYFHTVAAVSLEAGLDADGQLIAWRERAAFPSIGSTFNPRADRGGAGELGQGAIDLPFDVPNLRVETCKAPAHVRIGWLRSVCNIFLAYAANGFADELAAASGADPLKHMLRLLGPPRTFDPGDDGAQYGNYGATLSEHPLDTARFMGVAMRAADESGWGRDMPRGSGLGLAIHRSFLAYVAVVAQVQVSRDGKLSIPRIDIAADCGQVIAPDRVRAQMEGAAVFGASLAVSGEITAKGGAIVQGNFDDYTIARMASAPRHVAVHLIDSDAPPTGVGEPGVPPVAPAICNAIFAATGQRIRRLPLTRHDLSWS